MINVKVKRVPLKRAPSLVREGVGGEFYAAIIIAFLSFSASLLAQELISVHPHTTGKDTVWYSNVDEKSRPDPMFCDPGGIGFFRYKLSQTTKIADDYKKDTIETDKTEWTPEDEDAYDPRYNEEHKEELDELLDSYDEDREDLDDLADEAIEYIVQSRWNNPNYGICIPNCLQATMDCYTSWEITQITDRVTKYQYKTGFSWHEENDNPPHTVEIDFDLYIHYEAWVWFKVTCACEEIPGLMTVTPSEPGIGEEVYAQPTETPDYSIAARGTGRTTGHIADLLVTNNGQTPITTAGQTVYIASDGSHQGYFARIPPGITIPPGETVPVPVHGYCMDPLKPPIREGGEMRPGDNWVPVGDPIYPGAGTPSSGGPAVPLIPSEPVPPFAPEQIPGITQDPGFKPSTKPSAEGDITGTWPGTTRPVGGTIDPGKSPRTLAPLLVRIVELIEKAAAITTADPAFPTPFSGQPDREREVIIQQTIWICMGALLGEPYTRERFERGIYDQYRDRTGIPVSNLRAEDRNEVDTGITEFWLVFRATGLEAKVIRVGVAEGEDPDPGITISEPAPSCPCDSCRIARPLRIVDMAANKEITEDSIPTYIDRLQFDPPVIQSNCPEECDPRDTVEMRAVPQYHCMRMRPSQWQQGTMAFEVDAAGSVRIESRYRCTCEGKPCGSGNDSRRLFFTESNDCCDRIRCRNNGQLRFSFSSGNVVINGNQMILTMVNGRREIFEFDFNLEAIFCNLDDNQIYSHLQTLASQSTTGGNVEEYLNSQDISLDHPTDIEDMRPWYSLMFAKTVNDQEFLVSITIDEETCAYDLQVLIGGRLYEHAAPPYISESELTTMGIALGNASSGQFWHRAMIVLGHLLRAQHYDVESQYRNAYLNFVNRLRVGVRQLLRDPSMAAIHEQLSQLDALLTQAIVTGNMDLLDDILQAMIPIIGYFN